MRQEEKSVAKPPESQGMSAKENLELKDEVYIPDYVIHDFGNLETTRTEG